METASTLKEVLVDRRNVGWMILERRLVETGIRWHTTMKHGRRPWSRSGPRKVVERRRRRNFIDK